MHPHRRVIRVGSKRGTVARCRAGRRAPETLALRSWSRIVAAIDGYASGIVRVVGESYGADVVQHAWVEFTGGAAKVFQAHDPSAELFFSWLFHQWSPQREAGITLLDDSLYGVPPTRAFLDRATLRVDPVLQRYLETCLVTAPRFYEIESCSPRKGFIARDVLTGASSDVCEDLASTSLRRGEIIYARLVPIDGITIMDAISPLSFPQALKAGLIRLRDTQKSGEHGGRKLREVYCSLMYSERTI